MGHARAYADAARGGDTEACLAAVVTALIHTWTSHPRGTS